MKQISTLVLLSFLSIVSFAGEINKDIDVSSFSGLEISSFFDVTLVKGEVNSVNITIDSEYEPYLVVSVHAGNLRLALDNRRMPKRLRRKNHNYTAKAVITMPMVSNIKLSGAANLNSMDHFSSKELNVEISGAATIKNMSVSASFVDVKASGASNFDMFVETQKLDIEASGASKCRVEGQATDARYENSGASLIVASSLKAENINVSLSGASAAEVYVTEFIEIEASGASRIEYMAPHNVQVKLNKISGVSSVNYVQIDELDSNKLSSNY